MANTDIIIHDEKDNVGVVVIEKITPDQECNCWIMENDKSVKIQSKNEIPGIRSRECVEHPLRLQATKRFAFV